MTQILLFNERLYLAGKLYEAVSLNRSGAFGVENSLSSKFAQQIILVDK